MSTVETLQGLLRRFAPFAQLNDDQLNVLAEQARPFSCPTGQELLRLDRLPEQVYAVVEGRGRLLHSDPGIRRPVTLALSQPGDLVGWAGLVCRHPCEWLTASTPLKLIGIPAEAFYQLEEECESFRQWLDRNNSPSEIIRCLEPALRARPHADPDEREVLRRLLPNLQVLPARQVRELPTTGNPSVWLWDSLPPEPHAAGIQVGAQVDPQRLAAIPLGLPLRLIRVDAKAWEQALSPPLEAPPELAIEASGNPWQNDRYADLAAPAPMGEQVLDSDPAVTMASGLDRLPVRTGIGPVGQAMACLEMLAAFHGLPFRRDVMERITSDTMGNRSASIQSLGQLLATMTFRVTQADIPLHQMARAATPCVAIVRDQPSVIYKIAKGEVLAVLPEYGRVRFPLADLGNPDSAIRVLLISPGPDSQRKKLGLSWFLPQIRKYRRSLIEVLVASLVLQLLSLANPLIIQQIIDKVIGQQNLDTLYVLGLLLLLVAIFQGLLGAVRTYLFADTTNRIDIALGGEVIQHLLRLPCAISINGLWVNSPRGSVNSARSGTSSPAPPSPCCWIRCSQ